MNKNDAKEMVVLNYSMLCGEIADKIRNSMPNLSCYFDVYPELNTDKDLFFIAQKFTTFCNALKILDNTVNEIGERIEEKDEN